MSYAIAVFADQSGFEAFQAQVGFREKYAAVRSEIAAAYFNGNVDSLFTTCAVPAVWSIAEEAAMMVAAAIIAVPPMDTNGHKETVDLVT
jgi:hypothetical protein